MYYYVIMVYWYLLLPNDTFKCNNTEWGYFCLWRDRNSMNALIRLVFSMNLVLYILPKTEKKFYFKGKLTWLNFLNVLHVNERFELLPSVYGIKKMVFPYVHYPYLAPESWSLRVSRKLQFFKWARFFFFRFFFL